MRIVSLPRPLFLPDLPSSPPGHAIYLRLSGLPVTQVFEAGVFAEKGQIDRADRPVTLFADDQFSTALMVLGTAAVPFAALFTVDRLAIDKGDYVGILFNGARFAQIAHHGTLVGAFFQFAVQLGQGDYRHTQLLGQRLQRTGYLRDLLLAGFRVGTPPHQLQIVDDDQADIMF